MTVRIVVLAKQVPDPETPPSQFRIDESTNSVIPPNGVPPVVNGFDLNAVEAALQLRDAGADVEITVLSVGTEFVMDAMKKPLAMGADRLLLVDDIGLDKLDSTATVKVLAAAIEKDGPFDLILGGRQASDWDQGHVTLGLAEVLGLPLVSLVQKLEDANFIVSGGRGLGGPEPFSILADLANVLGGAVGASRAACDAGWIDHSHQIGLTGKSVSPDVYIAVGISGASQHMAGCSSSRAIVAINKDGDSNIFKEARFGVVGDWEKVLPSFIDTVRELKA